jgi:hypothetical protein
MIIDIAAICDAATTDSSGKLNILGTFDTIFASKFPAVHAQCAIAFRVKAKEKDLSNKTFEVRIFDTEDKVLTSFESKLESNGTSPHSNTEVAVNLIYNMANLRLEKPGKYRIELSFEKETLKEFYFNAQKSIPINR